MRTWTGNRFTDPWDSSIILDSGLKSHVLTAGRRSTTVNLPVLCRPAAFTNGLVVSSASHITTSEHPQSLFSPTLSALSFARNEAKLVIDVHACVVIQMPKIMHVPLELLYSLSKLGVSKRGADPERIAVAVFFGGSGIRLANNFRLSCSWT